MKKVLLALFASFLFLLAGCVGPNFTPDGCTNEYAPVCGTDGVTHPNSCLALQRGAQIAYVGKCTEISTDAPIACTMEYAPVCGNDGITYGNKCMANAANTQVAHEGECAGYTQAEAQKAALNWLTKSSPTFTFDGIEDSIELINTQPLNCPGCYELTYEFNSAHAGYGDRTNKSPTQKLSNHTIYIQTTKAKITYALTDGTYDEIHNITICMALSALIPVCGVDGKTYSHPCFANEAGVKIAYTGKCSYTACTNEYVPVCGMNGRTYHNSCFISEANIQINYLGECRDDKSGCTALYNPVCGKNGKTYSNECFANLEDMQIDYSGECKIR